MSPAMVLYSCYLTEAVLLRDSRPGGAVEACRRAISLGRPRHFQRFWNAHADVGYPLRKLGRRQEALDELRKALELERTRSEMTSFTGTKWATFYSRWGTGRARSRSTGKHSPSPNARSMKRRE